MFFKYFLNKILYNKYINLNITMYLLHIYIFIIHIISCDLYTFYKKVFKKLKVLFYNYIYIAIINIFTCNIIM